MNIFQQIFAEVSPHTTEILSAKNENTTPNVDSEVKSISKKSTISNHQEKASVSPSKTVKKQTTKTAKNAESLQIYQLSQQEADLDKKLSLHQKEIAKAKNEIEILRKQLDDEKKRTNTLASDNQLIQSYLDNAETFEQKKAKIQASHQKQLKEREEFWNSKINQLTKDQN